MTYLLGSFVGQITRRYFSSQVKPIFSNNMRLGKVDPSSFATPGKYEITINSIEYLLIV